MKAFQADRSIDVDGICGPETWSLLIEAGQRLGNRLLYLRTPHLRGDDVAEVQRMLSTLGFSVGRIDGIWGPLTADAVADFQINTGLRDDGVCGNRTIKTLQRLVRPLGDALVVAHITERQRLDSPGGQLAGCRIAVGEAGGLEPVTASVRRQIGRSGAEVLTVHHPDWSTQAAQVNRFGAAVYIGFEMRPTEPSISYFQGRHFVSRAGQKLAAEIAGQLEPMLGHIPTTGMGLPMLRESAMPAVLCRFGHIEALLERNWEVAEVITQSTRKLLADQATEEQPATLTTPLRISPQAVRS